MLKTLYSRLAAAMLVILLTATGLLLVIDLVSSRWLLQEVNQDMHRDLAANLLKESVPLDDGEIQPEALEHIFHMLMVINPAIEVYLVGPDGAILSYSGPEGSVVRMAVSLEPIREFLAGSARLPIFGDDPRSADGRKVFSAAPLASGDGYLYVILGGQRYETAAAMVQTSRTVRMGLAGLAATILAAIAIGLWMFARITRPVRSLANRVRQFQSGGLDSPEPGRGRAPRSASTIGSADEIAGLEASFAEMIERLGAQMDELQKTDALRRELVANVSHDLRTPITTLRGYLETLTVKSRQLSEEEKQRYIETALHHSERLGRLVSDLFELSKLDSLTTEVHLERVALGEFLHDVLQGFRLRCRERGITLEAAIDPSEVAFVETDVGLIERVLDNLLDNAIRHTPEGGRVTLRLRPEGDPAGTGGRGKGKEIGQDAGRDGGRRAGGYRVAVEDTGPGIPEADLLHLFDRFYRCSNSGESGHGGAGLGLAIARQILNLLDSELEVETVRPDSGTSERSGSTFSFVLPRA